MRKKAIIRDMRLKRASMAMQLKENYS